MKYYKYDIEKISSDFHLKESCSRFDCEEIIKSENAVSEKKKNLVEKLKSELQIDALVIEVDSTTAFGFDPSQIAESKSLDGTILVEGMILTAYSASSDPPNPLMLDPLWNTYDVKEQ